MLLYTGGLVERRRRALDVGLEVLVAGAGRGRDLAPSALAEHLLGELPGDGPHRDDVCVLAAT